MVRPLPSLILCRCDCFQRFSYAMLGVHSHCLFVVHYLFRTIWPQTRLNRYHVEFVKHIKSTWMKCFPDSLVCIKYIYRINLCCRCCFSVVVAITASSKKNKMFTKPIPLASFNSIIYVQFVLKFKCFATMIIFSVLLDRSFIKTCHNVDQKRKKLASLWSWA